MRTNTQTDRQKDADDRYTVGVSRPNYYLVERDKSGVRLTLRAVEVVDWCYVRHSCVRIGLLLYADDILPLTPSLFFTSTATARV